MNTYFHDQPIEETVPVMLLHLSTSKSFDALANTSGKVHCFSPEDRSLSPVNSYSPLKKFQQQNCSFRPRSLSDELDNAPSPRSIMKKRFVKVDETTHPKCAFD
jgi:hypothetical protein